ncbi:hypothetical protein JYU34_000749 [Plutella xylostella]|uniref:Uncharacterized protein n=1 Tax=Plutella xylostella TaxID=51655 RepID=A0ABQ7QNJ9_PLUXY|nr:hypothetical protein JYU34_007997 [Plutella xylostella]KAG7313595.1 hypothetical protein JYU34_000749 [Plutella xylostella]
MQKSINVLTNKVSALEMKIDEQNALISNQSLSIKVLTGESTHITDTPKTAANLAAAATTQRPVRQARLTAAKAILAGAAPKSKNASRPSLTAITTPKVPEDNRAATNSAPTIDPSARATPTTSAPKVGATKLTSAIPPNENDKLKKTTAEEDGDWQKVLSKRRKNRRSVTVGTGNADSELKTVEQIKYIQAWSFLPETTTENVMKFLNRIKSSKDYYVEKRNIKTTRHASFVIGIPECLFECFNSPTVWPPRVRFSDWFPARPRAAAVRGSAATPTTPVASANIGRDQTDTDKATTTK